MDLAQERIVKVARVLSDKELMYVMSLLVFDKLLDMVRESVEFKNIMPSIRTLQWWNIVKEQVATNTKLRTE